MRKYSIYFKPATPWPASGECQPCCIQRSQEGKDGTQAVLKYAHALGQRPGQVFKTLGQHLDDKAHAWNGRKFANVWGTLPATPSIKGDNDRTGRYFAVPE